MPHILLVEDDHALRAAFEQLLLEGGYRVSCASNGMEALLHLSRGPKADLIVLDLMMPTFSGWEFLSELRQHPQMSGTPVLVASAYSSPPTGVRIDGFIQKPFESDQFLTMVQRLATPAASASA